MRTPFFDLVNSLLLEILNRIVSFQVFGSEKDLKWTKQISIVHIVYI
jgi:hypothetical protein